MLRKPMTPILMRTCLAPLFQPLPIRLPSAHLTGVDLWYILQSLGTSPRARIRLILIITSTILCAQPSENTHSHHAGHVEPYCRQAQQERQEGQKDGRGVFRVKVSFFWVPAVGDDVGMAVYRLEDKDESDLAGEEPRDEEDNESSVTEGSEGEVTEHFGELVVS